MNNYKVFVSSKVCPGWEFYDGVVRVQANSDQEAEQAALKDLRKNFPERGHDAWNIHKIERT